MFIELTDPAERPLFVNTAHITHIRDFADRDFCTIYLSNDNELRLDRSQLKQLRTAIRRIGLEGGPR